MAGDAVGDRRIDRILGDVAADPQVVVVARFLGQAAPLFLHLVRGLPSADDHLADPAHGLAVRRDDAKRAEVVQDVLGGDGLPPDAALGERHVLGNARIQVVTHHQHVQVLIERIHRERPRRVGR